MFCTKCGARIVEGGKFCARCGNQSAQAGQNMPPNNSYQRNPQNDPNQAYYNQVFVSASAPKKKRCKWPIALAVLAFLIAGALAEHFDAGEPTAKPARQEPASDEAELVDRINDLMDDFAPVTESAKGPEPEQETAQQTQVSPEQPPVEVPGAVEVPAAAEVIPYFELRYYLHQLDAQALANFCAMYQSAASFEQWCTLPYGTDADELGNLLVLLNMECPELLQVDFGAVTTYLKDPVSGTVEQVEIPYRLTEAEYAAQYQACLDVIEQIRRAGAGLSDYEKEMLAYRSIATVCRYDIEAEHAATAYGAFCAGEAKCDGISLAMKWALEEMGIPCLVVYGDDPDGPIGHAWNIVRIDGQYYDLDLTVDVREEDSPALLMYYAVNVSDTWVRQHYLIPDLFTEYVSLPGTCSMDGSFFARLGTFVYAGQPYEDLLSELLLAVYDADGYVCIQFESESDFQSFTANYDQLVTEQMERLELYDCAVQVYYEVVNQIVCLEPVRTS